MKKYAYYNEIDPNAAEWIRQLIKLNLIPQGEVDERSIANVDADSIRSFCQHHFFCGIAVWPYALRQAGWDDERPIFTGSAPCQSFSAAGLQRGFDDKRHLWPHMFRIIRELRPSSVVGEQVSSKLALQWWDLVAGDLESEDYAAAAFDLSAASCGAPHHRSRLFWVANANRPQRQSQRQSRRDRSQQPRAECPGIANLLGHSEYNGHDGIIKSTGANDQGWMQQSQRPSDVISSLADPDFLRSKRGSLGTSSNDVDRGHQKIERSINRAKAEGLCQADIVADPNSNAPTLDFNDGSGDRDRKTGWHSSATSNSRSSTWDDAQWYPCRDGKYRPSGVGINPLAGVPGMDRDAIRGELEGILYRLLPTGHAIERTEEIKGIARLIENSRNWGSIKSRSSSMDDGTPAGMGCSSDPSVDNVENTQEARIMRLKGYGNAIVAPLAIEFLRSVMEIVDPNP